MILVILLVMAVGLTVGLSVASRSVTDVAFSTKIEESNRAFSAAEAGIENALGQGIYAAPANISGSTTDATYNVDLQSYGNVRNYSFPNAIKEGDGQTIWLTTFDPATGLPRTSPPPTGYAVNRWIAVCWSKDPSSSVIPALEISLFYTSNPWGTNNTRVTRLAFDPDSARATGPNGNGFITGSPQPISNLGNCGTSYDFRIDIIPYCGPPNCAGPTPMTPNPQSNSILVALRLKPVYAPALLAFRGDYIAATNQEVLLPEQGKDITSSGQTTSGVTRKWNVIQTYSTAPDIFDYAVWSATNLTK